METREARTTQVPACPLDAPASAPERTCPLQTADCPGVGVGGRKDAHETRSPGRLAGTGAVGSPGTEVTTTPVL